MEAELFGYVAGAFTGASHKGYQGKVRLADKGILFLDEIADLPLDAQSRLPHVLQDKTVLPVGTNHATKADIQIIAATHKTLNRWSHKGCFAKISTTDSVIWLSSCPASSSVKIDKP